MITQKQDEALRPIVVKYITSLEGRYSAHCSDKFLEALIMRSFGERCSSSTIDTFADSILSGRNSAAYGAVCWIFEGILEHGCQAGWNGHSVSQSFDSRLKNLLK